MTAPDMRAVVARVTRALDKYEDGAVSGAEFAPQVRHDLRDVLTALATVEAENARLRADAARLDAALGLHEVIEIRYHVDHYSAALLTRDGDQLVVICKGDSVSDAFMLLAAAMGAEGGA